MDEMNEIKQDTKKKVAKTGKVNVPLIPGEEKILHVWINGQHFEVPKGREVEVPLPVKEVIDNHLRSQYEAYERSAAAEFKD